MLALVGRLRKDFENRKERMMFTYRIQILAFGLMLCLGETNAVASRITISPFVLGTAVDDGPQDGVFDSFTPSNLGSVDNNGYTSFRTAFEFQLPAIPVGSTINAAALTLIDNVFEGPRQLALYGYAGDGILDLNDFSEGTLLGSSTVLPVGSQVVIFDTTSLVDSLMGGSSAFAGFNVREEPPNTPNFTVMILDVNSTSPALTIDFTEPLPEPSPLWLLGTVLVGLLGLRRLRQAQAAIPNPTTEPLNRLAESNRDKD
jgi:hypothetical protein